MANNKINVYRKRRHLTVGQLATMVGEFPQTIYSIINGKTSVRLLTAVRICTVLAAPLEDVFPEIKEVQKDMERKWRVRQTETESDPK